MTQKQIEQALGVILNQAESIRREFPEATDPDFYYMVGGIIANAEDMLGGLKNEREHEAFNAMFTAGVKSLAAGIAPR